MRERLLELLEKADLAIGSCAGVLIDDRLQPLIETTRRVRARLSYPDDVLVVALAGGTGSGKSSLLNALVGEELADVGGTRPTTQAAAAAVPQRRGDALAGYLDMLDIQSRPTYAGDGLCLLDLPDTDSVELEHRYRVDAVLPFVDVVVWVVDPEKYRDARLHDEYIQPLSGYGEQFVFVLNQADRLAEGDRLSVLSDLAAAASEDGVEQPQVIATAAAPPSGPPMIDELVETLVDLRSSPDLLYSKLLEDMTRTTRALESHVGAPLDFDSRARTVLDALTEAVVTDAEQATAGPIVQFLDDVALSLDGSSRAKVEKIAAESPAHLRRIIEETTPVPEPKRWFRKTKPVQRDPDAVRRLLGQALIRPVRAVLAKRALAIAAVAELRVAVESLGRPTSR